MKKLLLFKNEKKIKRKIYNRSNKPEKTIVFLLNKKFSKRFGKKQSFFK